jgi:small-conductance mechanosensitive channel
MSALGSVMAALAPFLPAAIIVVLTVVFAWLVSLLVGRLTRLTTPRMAGAARRLSATVVGLIGGTLTLQALGLSPDVLLLVVALLGVTVLIALRDPLSNYGAKYFSDIYTPFKVGDTIRVREQTGKVIEINPMSTILLAQNEQLVSVPNIAMIREVVVNTTPQAWKEVTVPITISGNVDLPAFESDLLKSFSKIRMRLDPRFPPVLTTGARTPQTTELVLTLMLRRPEDRDAITQETNKRVAELLSRSKVARR